jgi:hypothetical protein
MDIYRQNVHAGRAAGYACRELIFYGYDLMEISNTPQCALERAGMSADILPFVVASVRRLRHSGFDWQQGD